MFRFCLAFLSLFFLLGFVPALSMSSDVDEEGVLFYGEETVSTPSRRPQPIEEAPAPVTVITREDIRDSGALTLPEVLALATGVDTIRRSEANVEVTIRGFNSYGSDKVLVMLDSRPLFNLADASINWNLIPVSIDKIERIEIVRGPGSVLYGENAFFGTINIITQKSGADSARLSGGWGTGESLSAGAGISLRNFSIHGEHLELGRFSDQGMEIPNQLLEELGVKPAVAMVNISRAFMRWEPEYDSGSYVISGGFSQVRTDYISFRTVDRMALISIDNAFRDQGIDYELGLRVLGQEQQVSERPFPSGRPYQRFLRADLDLRGVYNPVVSDVVVFGINFSHRTMKDDIFLEAVDREIRQAVISGFLENQLALANKNIFLTTGVRADGYQGLRGMASPRAGLVFLISPEQSVKIGWGQAFRSPTVYELYGEDTLTPPWVFRGNSGLRPESVSSWNLDYFCQEADRFTISISLFHHDIHDLIIYLLDPQSLTQRIYHLDNVDSAASYGGEIEVHASITKRTRVWANYSYNEASYFREDEDIEAPFSPRHKANAGVSYADDRWRLSVWGRYVGEQVGVNFDTPFQNRVILKDYGAVSARLELRLGYDLNMSVTASDILGEGHYEAPTYAPVTPYYFVRVAWEPE
jgi:outer membrane receptor for ferrienterochelin and colicin